MRKSFVRQWIGASLCTLVAVAACCNVARADSAPSLFAPAPVSQPFTHEPEPEGPRLQWNKAWPRFRPIGYVLTTMSVTGALASTFLIPYPENPRWVGGIMFDNSVREALRARDEGLRDAIRLISDVTLFASVLQVGLIDGFLVPALDGAWDVAWQLTLMNAQALSLNILIATLLFKAVARARPIYDSCEADRTTDPLCDTGSFASFPSSHTSTAATAAGLTCVHHAHLPLYGGPPWDAMACAGSLVLAVATGLFRVVGDRHYLTDVVLGAAFGFSLGYLYPYLLHYQYGPSTDWVPAPTSIRWGITPGAARAPLGVSVIGLF